MGALPADVVKRLILNLKSSDVILLRGRTSILSGNMQNDIDIFVPKCAWDSSKVFGTSEVISSYRFGSNQLKVLVRERLSDCIVEVDVFHEITWRGIRLIDISNLPIQSCPELNLKYLDKDAEAWVTVLKNVLHGSITPKNKLHGITGEPSFLSFHEKNIVKNKLSQKLIACVWETSRQHALSYQNVLLSRMILFLIRVIDEPIKTFSSIIQWLAWRILQGRRLK